MGSPVWLSAAPQARYPWKLPGSKFHEWGNCDQGRHILIAVSRYLAAHFPTQRALLQTADIATRLMRGGELHREAQAMG
jgi:hypothetical protein